MVVGSLGNRRVAGRSGCIPVRIISGMAAESVLVLGQYVCLGWTIYHRTCRMVCCTLCGTTKLAYGIHLCRIRHRPSNRMVDSELAIFKEDVMDTINMLYYIWYAGVPFTFFITIMFGILTSMWINRPGWLMLGGIVTGVIGVPALLIISAITGFNGLFWGLPPAMFLVGLLAGFVFRIKATEKNKPDESEDN